MPTTVIFSKKLTHHKYKDVYYLQIPKKYSNNLEPKEYTILVTDKLTSDQVKECFVAYTKERSTLVKLLKQLVRYKYNNKCLVRLVDITATEFSLASAIALTDKLLQFKNKEDLARFLDSKFRLFNERSQKILYEWLDMCLKSSPNK